MFKPGFAFFLFALSFFGWAFAAAMSSISVADEIQKVSDKPWQVPGEIQKPGEMQKISDKPWQVPGEFQKPGEFQVPGDIQKAGTVDGCSVTLTAYSDTLFEFDKSTLAEGADKPLEQAAAAIAAEQKLQQLRIRGHTDAKGSEAYNEKLSQDRASTVKEWLSKRLEKTVPTRVEALGERKPIKPNAHPDGSDNPDGRAFNRRVELVLELCSAS